MTTPSLPAAIPQPFRPKLAVLAALSIELSGLKSLCTFGPTVFANGFRTWESTLEGVPILVVETGVGFRRAEKATQAIIDAYKPTVVLSVGLCGGLNDELPTGQLILAKSVKRTAGRAITCSQTLRKEDLLATLNAREVQVITADAAVTSVEGKQALRQSSKGDVVDMESFAVVDICHQRQVKFGVLRVISDDAKTTLPTGVMSLIGETGALRVGALVGTLWHKPSSMVDLWKLRNQSLACSQTLARGLQQVCTFLAGMK